MKGFLRFFAVMILVLGFLSEAHAARVLLMGDGGSETEVQQALVNAGHDVTYGGLYWEWAGSNPNPDNFGLIIYLDGVEYGNTLQESAAMAVNQFVARGCGLVLTEWTTYEVYDGDEHPIIENLMPVYTPDQAYAYGDTWTVQDTGHPLTQGVPSTWEDTVAGWSWVTAKIGTVVLITGTDGNPLISYSNVNGGTVVHINHDMAYTENPINANALQLIVNAADYASCSVHSDDERMGGHYSGDAHIHLSSLL
ncbi:MAG: hypothetical protein HF978_16735 [Desulfobacteraceae bacterium]|nr:hypothetical protein [Desulfobacteraceae bacterium]MBC2757190.1 hypothetical protein [Desulfobacteraceae bacterium]